MVQVEWHREWTPAVTAAFEALPYDELMDIDVVRRLYRFGSGRARQQIAVLRTRDGQPVGVVPLQWRQDWRGLFSWELLTQMVLPYARLHVLPGYTDAALAALNRYIACDNVVVHELPQRIEYIRPETSWVVQLPPTYAELLRRTNYIHEDRRCRKKAARLELYENRYSDLPVGVDHWAQKWSRRGHHYSARRKDELLLVFRTLAEQGRLRTFSVYEGSRFVGMQMDLIGATTLYFHVTITLDEYRAFNPGVRLVLESMQRACEQGLREYDMLYTYGHFKQKWAQPVTRSYRLVRGPWNAPALGGALEAMGSLANQVYWKFGWRQ